MKRICQWIAISIVPGVLLAATPFKPLHGDTANTYQKPGAPVTMRYRSEHHYVDEMSQVTITLTTPLKEGEMSVTIRPDNALTITDTHRLKQHFLLDGRGEYTISLTATSTHPGRHYLRLFVSMGEKGTRAFVVPVVFESDDDSYEKVAQERQRSLFHIKATVTIKK